MNFAKVNLKTQEGREEFRKEMRRLLGATEYVRRSLAGANVREFTNAANFPAPVLPIIQTYQVNLTELDTTYEAAFDILNFRGTKQSGWTVREVQSGLTFRKMLSGEGIDFYGVEGTAINVMFDKWGGGLGWDQAWIDDEEWWNLQRNAIEFRLKWYRDKATAMYGLIQSLTNDATHNTVYDTTGANQTAKDINTINAAVLDLIVKLQASGYFVNDATQFVMLCPQTMKDRIIAAQKGVMASGTTAGDQINHNITFYFSPYLNWTTQGNAGSTQWVGKVVDAKVPLGYLSVPKFKNQLGERMDLTLFDEFDISRYAQLWAGWGRYAAIINEPQWRRLLSA